MSQKLYIYSTLAMMKETEFRSTRKGLVHSVHYRQMEGKGKDKQGTVQSQVL